MGTLTGNQDRLPEYCDHKLPTSCRLTSIPNCCACADERAHAPSYSTYIDGIGFVSRGNRWQRYCWFCKEFWAERVRASGLRPAQTKLPEVPDQTAFLERWYEFHRGFRTIVKDDGNEERIAVLGEELKDVDPGVLPRTLEELRAGRRAEEVQQVEEQVHQTPEESGTNLEETLDQLFENALSEERNQPSADALQAAQHAHQRRADIITPSNTHTEAMEAAAAQIRGHHPDDRGVPFDIHAVAMNAAAAHAHQYNSGAAQSREYQLRRVAALRRELRRMQSGIERVISGLRDLGEDVPDSSAATDLVQRLDDMVESSTSNGRPQDNADDTQLQNSPAANLQHRVDTARARFQSARTARQNATATLSDAESEFRSASQQFQQLRHEQRTMENYTRLFGTREEMVAAGEDYVSPIGNMFERAGERFRAAEQVRREQRTLRRVLDDEEAARAEEGEGVPVGEGDAAMRLAELAGRPRDVWGVPRAAEIREIYLPHETTNDTSEGANGTETPPVLLNTGEESRLEEYYSLLRRQGLSTQPFTEQVEVRQQDQNSNDYSANFERSMLDAIVNARRQELAERDQNDIPVADAGENIDDNSTGPLFSQDQWWHQDAEHVLRALTADDALREELGMDYQQCNSMLAYFNDDMISEGDRMILDGLFRNPVVIWRTALPTEWLSRRRELLLYPHGIRVGLFFTGGRFDGLPAEDGSTSEWAEHFNPYMRTELVAQVYQMSGEMRRLATSLSPPERLQMLYRLQAGRRDEADVQVIEENLRDNFETYEKALDIYRQYVLGEASETERMADTRRQHLDDARLVMAYSRAHSRQELQSRRAEASALAIAAGRQAMATDPQALVEQNADIHVSTNDDQVQNGLDRLPALHRLAWNRATGEREVVYRQLTLSDYLENSDSDTDSNFDDETSGPSNRRRREADQQPNRGLDAADSGRPEPKSEEDLTVQMECKICYTQLAEVACLPCGHLVMCRWCSEQHSPCMRHDRTTPRRPSNCPVCRKRIRQKVRCFRA